MYYHSDGKDDTNGVYRLTLGVTVASKNSRYIYDEGSGYGRIQEDITVLETAENSISARMGLQKDDIIKAIVIDGVRYNLDRYFYIADYLLALTENTTFYFIYERDGEESNTFEYCVTQADLAQIA